MSHFTKIKTKLYNQKIIEKSLTDLNFDWKVGREEIRGYKNQKLSTEIIIRQNNNHIIGFKWNNNEYEIVTDIMFWEQTFSMDKFLNRIHQRYTLNLIKEVNEKQNLHLVQIENLKSGSVRFWLKKF